ncbi:adenylate kinase [Candidatus Atelocyanobacterium thalassae]|uniref:Adenylate kinase n=2 Tax=Candidatus Atelocyanobacterium thalassae TaxID=713887 RepID=A0A086CHK3_9CHRO|nr:adenylate kinase [Candidatus Atelocyanobacterium thalassa]KFF41667.1 MAG: Adenylate kinase [Candidatus Atelocyanobacterium thalassa isolate SIO64986]BDA39246.1 adenylate kinase [cyanobacterium endosymbiont of Braarudosphaera bigelowii]
MSTGKGLIFLGPPGSGKGTQAQKLSAKFNIPHISTGEMLREAITNQTKLGQEAQSYVDKGELVPDKLLLGLIQERLNQQDAQKGWILDGFPRNIFQAEFLDTLLKRLSKFSEQAVNLEVPDEVIVERLLLRGRKDDSEKTIRRRLEVYREKTQLVLDYYRQNKRLVSIDGNLKPDEVTIILKNTLTSGLTKIF